MVFEVKNLKYLSYLYVVLKNLIVFLLLVQDEKILENTKLEYHKLSPKRYHNLFVFYFDRK